MQEVWRARTDLDGAADRRCVAGGAGTLGSRLSNADRCVHGSTSMLLATQTTGRGGGGSPEAKAQQKEIVRLLEEHGATE
jgi:hypothetical protein